MFTSTKTILKLFSTTALIRANGILKNCKNVDELVDTASKEIHSGKKKIGAIARPEDIIFTAELPKTRSGKIMRRLLDDATVIGFVVASIGKDIQNFRTCRFSHTETVEHLPA